MNKKIQYIAKFVYFSIIIIFVSFININLSDKQKMNRNTLEFIFAGDFIPHNSIRKIGNNSGYLSCFYEIKFANPYNSLNFLNLETTILKKEKKFKPFVFSANKNVLKALKVFKFDYLNIANNHILDFSKKGFFETLEILKKMNIKYSGTEINNKPYIRTFYYKGYKIGFIGITLLMNNYFYFKDFRKNEEKPFYIYTLKELLDISNYLKKLKKNKFYDILIVSLHWSKEYFPDILNYQRKYARILIDNGIDIVWGHHPHIFQPVEIYKNKIIIYSSGNFVTGQAIKLKDFSIDPYYFLTRAVPIIKIIYKNKKFISIELIPFYQKNNYNKYIRNQRIKFKSEIVPIFYFKKNINNILLDNYENIFLNFYTFKIAGDLNVYSNMIRSNEFLYNQFIKYLSKDEIFISNKGYIYYLNNDNK